MFHVRTIVTLCCVLLAPTAFGATYHVSPQGQDAADGSAAHPWQTLQHAANRVQPGDAVIVAAGSYAGFQLTTSGTAAARITFRGTPGVVINRRMPGTNPQTAHGINLEGASHVTIEDFVVDNTTDSITRHCIRTVSASHVIIRGNTARGCGVGGILAGFSVDLLIENNRCSGAKLEHGIYVANSRTEDDNVIVRGNTVFRNGTNGIQFNGDCFFGGDGILSRSVIENNLVYENGVKGLSLISFADGIVRNNVIHDNFQAGKGAGGIHLVDQPGCGKPSHRNLVVNNTVIEPQMPPLQINHGSGNVVFNNLLVNPAAQFIVLEAPDNAVDEASNLKRLSVAGLFVDAPGHDYHLAADSPAVDTGKQAFGGKVAAAVDLDGRARPQGGTPDVGAYERCTTDCSPLPSGPDGGGSPRGPAPAGGCVVGGSAQPGAPLGVLWLGCVLLGRWRRRAVRDCRAAPPEQRGSPAAAPGFPAR